MSDNGLASHANGSPGIGRDSAAGHAVLVVGAGIAGMQSALLLAEAGHQVYLLDSAPGIGGSMHLLDRTFPTDSCGICLMLPGRAAYCPTIECDLHENIEILPYSEVEGVSGQPGCFTVTVRHKPRYVGIEACTNCGLCAQVCPVERPHEYEGESAKQRAIYQPPIRSIPSTYVIDMDYCTLCGECAEVCPVAAVDLKMAETETLFEVGAVVVSPGYEPVDAGIKGEYGFGHYDNVLSSIQFERMISLSGSTGGRIVRPSDGDPPRRIAFIQCVGSRDPSIDRGYCSSVCCMLTAKQVQLAKKLDPDLDVTVFFMDIRAHGKDFDDYFDRVEATPGVSYQRAMVSSIHEYKQTGNLLLNFVQEDGSVREEDFQMVVLSVGFEPARRFRALGRSLDIELNRYGFGQTPTFRPGESSRPGIFLGGAFREPKDIPETVVEASAVAAAAASARPEPWRRGPECPSIGRESQTGPEVSELPEEKDTTPACEAKPAYEAELDWPRVGVFLCDCRGEIGSVVDLPELSRHAQGFRDAAVVQIMDNACLLSGRRQIAERVAAAELNRIVIAGCPAREYQSAFDAMMREAGLNPALLGRVNLRGEIAWVHQGNGRDATAKAKELVQMAVADIRLAEPVHVENRQISRGVLIIGGGLAGMTAALALANMGHDVDLLERSNDLGGQLRELRYVPTGEDPVAFATSLIDAVESHRRIHVYRQAEITDVTGYVGHYRTTVAQTGEGSQVLSHGAIIVATGGHEVMPTEYLYGKDARVVTQRGLDRMLDQGEDIASDVVMIQCVGSREPERPYCSRVCCTKAVTNALRIKERNPGARVFVLYREMRTYGFREDYYREAREQGVIFLRYEPPDKPSVVQRDGELSIHLREPITGEDLELRADLLVLSTGVDPNEVDGLADLLGLPLDKNGFFQEEYPKMRPLDFTRLGIFMCGLAHSPRFSDETIMQAQGAAMRAAALLKQRTLQAPVPPVMVNERVCAACGQCVEICPFEARVLEAGSPTAEVIEVLCQGCGACIVACPNKATRRQGATVPSVYRVLDAVTQQV